MNLAIGLVIGLFLGFIPAYLFYRSKLNDSAHLNNVANEGLKETFKALAADTLRQNSEQFLMMADEKLTSKEKAVNQDLGSKKEMIEKMVEEIRRDVHKSNEELKKSEQQRIASYSALKEELEGYRKITQDLKGSTDDLRKILSNNQMRGQFGEQVAENLLKMAGFVQGQDYEFNKKQEKASTRPDFTIYMPDKTKINVDAKFPYTALIRLSEAETETEKKKYLAQFSQDVKEKIRQVTTRDYINPEENTVDFVILFIPNEMIFSFIYDQLHDVWQDALAKKVIFAGPFTFTAILRMVKQAYDNFRYQKNLAHIIVLIQKFAKQYEKYSEGIDVLGKRIRSVEEQFSQVSITRDRMLTRVVDKIKSEGEVSGLAEGESHDSLLD